MSTIENNSNITHEIRFDDFQTSEYCSLWEEDNIGYAEVTYCEKALAEIMTKLPATGLEFDLSADVSELFEVELFDEDGNSVTPKYHRGFTVTISMYLGSMLPSIEFKSTSKFDGDDWAVFRLRLSDEALVAADQPVGYFVTVTQRSPSGAEHDTSGVITGPAGLTAEMVERVALNLVTFCDQLHRAPAEDYGDNVFSDCENADINDGHSSAHCYWIVTIKPVAGQDLATLTKYMTALSYETLLQHGEVEIL